MDIRRVIDLRARDDREVPAILLTPEPARSGTVLVHDFGGCKEDLLRLLVELGQLGVAVAAHRPRWTRQQQVRHWATRAA